MKLFFAYTKGLTRGGRAGKGLGCEKFGHFWLKPYMTRVKVTMHKDEKKAKISEKPVFL
jgi:hypothetical protein